MEKFPHHQPVPAKSFSRQLQYLQVQANEILKEDGVFRNGLFYQKLEPFLKFYTEIKKSLLENSEPEEQIIKEHIKALPAVEFKNYDEISSSSFVYTIGYVIFFPVGIFYLVKKSNYVRETKSKLREIASICSSLEFLMNSK